MSAGTPLAYMGTSFPSKNTVISSENLGQLTYVAQWGWGVVERLAVSPDGSAFFAVSHRGVARYSLDDPEIAPQWIPFPDEPIWIYELEISEEGRFLKLNLGQNIRYFAVATGKFLEDVPNVSSWSAANTMSDYQRLELLSPDGSKTFIGFSNGVWYDEVDGFQPPETIRRMFDASSDQLLYEIADDNFVLDIFDRVRRESCDVHFFSPSGNAFEALPIGPARAAFSSSGDTLAVLHRSAPIGFDRRFSLLRVYRVSDGRLIQAFGQFNDPVEDFAYVPETEDLIIVYGDGRLERSNVVTNIQVPLGRPFNSYLFGSSFNLTGDYLINQFDETIEVRLSSDWTLRSRLKGVAHAVSPSDDWLAFGDQEGQITIQEPATGNIIQRWQAHTDRVLELAFSPDGTQLVSSSEDCTVRSWDLDNGGLRNYFEETEASYTGSDDDLSRIFFYFLSFIPGTDSLIGFGSYGTTVVWDTKSGDRNYVVGSAPLDFYQGSPTVKPHFSELFGIDLDAGWFSIGDLTYDLASGALVSDNVPTATAPDGCSAYGPSSLDGGIRFTRGYGHREGQVCVLEPESLTLLDAIQVVHPDTVWDLAIASIQISPNGEQLLIATVNGIFHVFEIQD